MTDELLTQKLYIEISEREKAQKKAKLKWLTPTSLIKTTRQVSYESKKKNQLDETSLEIHRNLKLDLLIWLIMCFIFIIPTSYIVFQEIKENDSNIVAVIFAILLMSLLIFAAYKNLTLRALTTPIILTKKNITLNNETFSWNDIQETFYVYRFPGGVLKFVIGFRDGQIRYFDIGNQLGFKYNERDFSKFIEHYKHLAEQENL